MQKIRQTLGPTLERAIENRLEYLGVSEFVSVEDAYPLANYRSLPLDPDDFTSFRTHAPQVDLNSRSEVSKTKPVNGYDITKTQTHQLESTSGTIVVSGTSLLCNCPDCGAPMTIRLWLSLADCWRCPTSIALTEQDVQLALELSQPASLKKKTTATTKQSAKQPISKSTPSPAEVRSSSSSVEARSVSQSSHQPIAKPQDKLPPPPPAFVPSAKVVPQPQLPRKRQASSATPQLEASSEAPLSSPKKDNSSVGKKIKLPLPPPKLAIVEHERLLWRQRELERVIQRSFWVSLVCDGYRNASARTVRVALQAFLAITLATLLLWDALPSTLYWFSGPSLSRQEPLAQENVDALQTDLLQVADNKLTPEETRHLINEANAYAKQLQVDPSPIRALPELSSVKKVIASGSTDISWMGLANRDPRVRSEMVRKLGGSTLSEAAVAKGIRWLASVRNQDGGWSLSGYDNHDLENNQSDTLGTALALLPMLGTGQTHQHGRYKELVASGLAWLLKHQQPNGDFRDLDSSQNDLLAHAVATIVLSEALEITGETKFVEPVRRAVKYIEAKQLDNGGWEDCDASRRTTELFAWQLMALESVRAGSSGIEVAPTTIDLASVFLKQPQVSIDSDGFPPGAIYGAGPNKKGNATSTSEAVLCQIYLGWHRDNPKLEAATKWLTEQHLPARNVPKLEQWFFGSQVMHQVGGIQWNDWNQRARGLLISMQQNDGDYTGSWSPHDFELGRHDSRIYSTALAICTLEVYYRYLPKYRSIELSGTHEAF